jgi:hypothetical protein
MHIFRVCASRLSTISGIFLVRIITTHPSVWYFAVGDKAVIDGLRGKVEGVINNLQKKKNTCGEILEYFACSGSGYEGIG